MRKKQVYTYEQNRDLLTQVQNYINGGVISQYDYVNDALGRRTAITRSGSMMSETRTDCYGYNDRNELVSATKNTENTEYQYSYDDIGNRISSLDLGTNRTYTANELNQYTNIVDGVDGFLPEFDLYGNQTLIKTATGVWSVTYNGENRPVLWECGTTNIVMKFDRMGRRVEYIETVSGVTNAHHRFVYDGYLCIQRLNAASNNAIDLVFGWDPSEPVATRPLVLQKYGQYSLFYTHDGNKNVSELVFFQQANGIAAHYEYAPFGAVTATSSSTPVTAYDFKVINPFKFSSEYFDSIIGLFYYNYRHYNSREGRWTSRDPLGVIVDYNLFESCGNSCLNYFDYMGLKKDSCKPGEIRNMYFVYDVVGMNKKDMDKRIYQAYELLRSTESFAAVNLIATAGISASPLLWESATAAAPSITLTASDIVISGNMSADSDSASGGISEILASQYKADKILYPEMVGWLCFQRCECGLLGGTSWHDVRVGPSSQYSLYSAVREISGIYKWYTEEEAKQLINEELRKMLDAQ